MKIIALFVSIFIGCTALAVTPDNYENLLISWKKHQKLVQNSNYRDLPWRNIGPVVQGGRAVAIRQSLQNDSILYIAYASGGVWKSIDKGITFAPITDKLPSQIVGSFAIDPNNDQILWLGTGENNSSRSSYAGMGVYRSLDAGVSWQYMGLGDTNRIGDIIVDPNDSNRIYVAALGPLYSKGGDRGVFVSQDGGQSWDKVLAGDKVTGFVDLSIAANGDIYASAWQRMRKAWNFEEAGIGSKIYKSSDYGQSWKKLANGLPSGRFVGRMGVATAASDANIIYVVVDNQELLPEAQWDMGGTAVNAKRLKTMSREELLLQDKKHLEKFLRDNNFPPETTAEIIIEKLNNKSMDAQDLVKSLKDANANLFNTDIKGLEVYRSDDAGDSFYKTHDLPLANVVFTYGYYFGKIRVDPNDADTVYTLGVPLIKSTDGGKTWMSLYDPKVHVDYHDLWIDPKNSKHIIAANDGGADESYDGGDNWRKLDYQPVGQFYTIGVDLAEPYNVYGGLQDNGTLKGSSQTKWTDGESWQRLFGGDGMYVNVHEDSTYVGYQFGNYFRIENGKSTSIKPPNFINEKPLRYNWNTPVILSSHNKDIIYYGANKLFRSFDKGETYSAISKDLTQSLKYGDVPYATITSISESPLEFGRIIVGTDDGMVWVTADDGRNWKNVSKKLPKKLWVSRVVASQYDKNELWLTLNNYRNDDIGSYVYHSKNFGKSWQSIVNNLPNEAVNVIKEDPKVKHLVYIGTDKGLYFSVDAGLNWQTLGAGLPTVPVHDLVIHPRENELVVATHGRSVWIADITYLQNYKDYQDKSLFIFESATIKFNPSWNSRLSRWYSTPKPASTFTLWSSDNKTVQINLKDEHEQTIYSNQIQLHKGLNLWSWDNKLNTELALKAEQFNNKDKKQPLNKALTPVSETIRLGYETYIQPGKYTLVVSHEDKHLSAEITVK
ncbi:Glycosyl hydrolase, BNR repeat precursor [hydrothermal vent metagenome]|uniref:Glycosyl hydrolase, BNR repeat n=1 Tax=hydrothermal vent metagenome TaxID=652676 RepID=A0A3B0VCD5_9ZZZZ